MMERLSLLTILLPIFILAAPALSQTTTATPTTTTDSSSSVTTTGSSVGSDDSPDPDLTLTITKNAIEVGLDKYFDVECMYNRSDKTQKLGVTSMQLEHKPEGEANFGDIASIVYDFSGDGSVPSKVKHYKSLGGIVSGLLTKDGSAETFIKFEWVYPLQSVVGQFRCIVSTMSSFGDVKKLQKTVEVTKTDATLDGVVTRVIDIDLSVDDLKELVDRVHRQASPVREQVIIREHVYGSTAYLLARRLWATTLSAQTLCLKMGAYLLEVNDADEFNAVKSFIAGEEAPILVGATSSRGPGWRYMRDQAPLTFEDWAAGADKNNLNKRCMMLVKANNQWVMDSVACSAMNLETFICEMRAK